MTLIDIDDPSIDKIITFGCLCQSGDQVRLNKDISAILAQLTSEQTLSCVKS
jgi:hypothetical protein